MHLNARRVWVLTISSLFFLQKCHHKRLWLGIWLYAIMRTTAQSRGANHNISLCKSGNSAGMFHIVASPTRLTQLSDAAKKAPYKTNKRSSITSISTPTVREQLKLHGGTTGKASRCWWWRWEEWSFRNKTKVHVSSVLPTEQYDWTLKQIESKRIPTIDVTGVVQIWTL